MTARPQPWCKAAALPLSFDFLPDAFRVRYRGRRYVVGATGLGRELGEGTPDGICIDAEGCVWYADERIALDRGGFACMPGGVDRKTLLITAAR